MAGEISRENGKKGGRPKGYSAINAEAARKFIIEQVNANLGDILKKQVEQAMAGDAKAREDLYNRAYGKPKETVELQGQVKLAIDV